MNKLLRANFARLKKNKIFWIGIAFMIFVGCFLPIRGYFEMKYTGRVLRLDDAFAAYASLIGVLSSVFCSLFIGAEYSDGTIRNKIVVGRKRTSIYLSNLILCAAASLLMCASFIVSNLCAGIPTLGFFKTDLKMIAAITLCSFVMSIALSSIYTLISMSCQNKAISSVVCILIAFALLLVGVSIYAKLSEPEKISYYSIGVNGEEPENIEEVNPNYLRGSKRKAYEFLYDFTPGGQAVQLTSLDCARPVVLILYSSIITIACAGGGLIVFRKKDLK